MKKEKRKEKNRKYEMNKMIDKKINETHELKKNAQTPSIDHGGTSPAQRPILRSIIQPLQ